MHSRDKKLIFESTYYLAVITLDAIVGEAEKEGLLRETLSPCAQNCGRTRLHLSHPAGVSTWYQLPCGCWVCAMCTHSHPWPRHPMDGVPRARSSR